MGAYKLAENAKNVPEFICPNCLLKPKVWDFDEKRLHWASVGRGLNELPKKFFSKPHLKPRTSIFVPSSRRTTIQLKNI